MPPLPLPRHLRPCHISRNAPYARYSSPTARVKYSTDGDNSVHNSISRDVRRIPTEDVIDKKSEEAKETKVWWSMVKDGIAKFGVKTVVAIPEELQDKRKKTIAEQSIGREWQSQVAPEEMTREAYDTELAGVKLQLQQLAEQVSLLRSTLSKLPHSTKSEMSPVANLARYPSPDSTSPQLIPQKKGSIQPETPLGRALYGYRNSVSVLMSTFEELDEIAPRSAARIAVPLAQHLHLITSDEMVLKDRIMMSNAKMKKKFKRYKANHKWYPITMFKTSRGEESQTRREHMYHLYLLGRAYKCQSQSFYTLIDVGNGLGGVRPRVVSPIKVFLLKQLRDIAETATREGDERTLNDLNQYKGNAKYLKAMQAYVHPHPEEIEIAPTSTGSGQAEFQTKREKRNQQQDEPHKPLNSEKLSAPESIDSRSLFHELFPETNSTPLARASETKDKYAKLDLPISGRVIQKQLVDRPKTMKEQIVESFQNRGEQITVLQLSHCSTELVEADFRRLIPKGLHIDTWLREGEFTKIIPGRDPLSLERLPFYYILFKNPESAFAYQKNVSRLHKLSALHQPSNIFSAIPPPRGFLEDGEDLNAITSMYNLVPTQHPLNLRAVMQPYSPALRDLIDRGGYHPIVPDNDGDGNRIWKVLMRIEGYEPMPSDLFKVFRRDAFMQGLPMLTLRNESSSSIHRLRDLVNLKTKKKGPHSSLASPADLLLENQTMFEDPAIQSYITSSDDERSANEINQTILNRLYNRWIIEFGDEDAALRFSRTWHRRILPAAREGEGWKEQEEERVCNVEVLW